MKEVVAGLFLPTPPAALGVAVSGGSDSMALLCLLSDFAKDAGMALHVATVDHGLRPEAAAEAETVARQAGAMGHSHDILRWHGWDRQGNLQAAARTARYDLLASWARGKGLGGVALGHTADDQAETLLMRLARASGADGLAGMSARRTYDGVQFLRPMLGLRRADLRAGLQRRGVGWIDDPSNDDQSFERVRVRRALALLEPLGLSVPTLCTVADNQAAVVETLNWYGFVEARAAVRIEGGDVVIARADLLRLRPEILRRLLVAAIRWLTGSVHPPRRRALRLLIESLQGGTGMALNGCLARVTDGTARLTREANAVAGLTCRPNQIWDGRWRLRGPEVPEAEVTGAEIRALGEIGLAQCPDWRDTGMPRVTLIASPAVWRGSELIAAPLAGRANGWTAELTRTGEAFHASFLTH
ncbi:tRNA lysidine(34) synthetase TilS [Pseudooceanicola sp.]|uniref:tRNA lysidine(34) synthetase TilS n=1 Tax=Pseudooceanicola sp. TaxID=1914328 RepID=UPI0026360E6C|nr:tRNA lysidine(34) synthetase TilS [Pseudooceanicola sp.]MDF1856535.1 tRNA lysidine(34) synthetase TilS [Pseudooceanicola sp.]